MSNQKWRPVAEVGGMLVVVASLLIVVYELRQNTDALRGSTIDAVTEHQQFELYWSSEIAPVFVKAIQTPAELDAVEAWQLSEWYTAAITARQNEFSQYKLGLVDEQTWLVTEGIIQLMLSFKWAQEWWAIYREIPWDEEFTLRVDELVEESTFDYKQFVEQISNVGSAP